MNYFLNALQNHYADFNGRARRKEYWMFVLFQIIFAVIAGVLDNLLGLSFSEIIPYGWIYTLYGLAMFIPGLAIAVRRLHDVGKSGWYYLIILIPLVGSIWLLVLLCTDSEHGTNKWGDNPKGMGGNAELDQLGKE